MTATGSTPRKRLHKIAEQHNGKQHRLLSSQGPKVSTRLPDVDGIVWTRDVKSEPIKWLWTDYLPRARFIEFIGDPGVGKSTAALDIAARMSTGSPMPGGSPSLVNGASLILKCEDGNSDVAGRLEALGADTNRVGIISDHLTFPKDAERLRELIVDSDAKLVVIDTLASFLGGIGDGASDALVRRAVRPLIEIAEESDCNILAIRHLVKGDKTNAVYSSNGSIGFTAMARASLLFARDPLGGDSEFIMARSKANFGKHPASLRYTIREHSNSFTFLDWTGESSWTADGLVQHQTRKPRPRDEAVEFLKSELASGPVATSVLKQRAHLLGISPMTLRRATVDVGVTTKQPRGDQGKLKSATWAL